ncbi:MAG: glycosyltransferase family 9 protein [Bdellovibrionales bacterium]|nr:glycosyltransferase family 9 protein [Bdellovibrionales bacterium]
MLGSAYVKILVIRFSSIGDVLQCLSVAGALLQKYPQAEIHWVTRSDLEEVVRLQIRIQKVFSISSKSSFAQIKELAARLRQENYTHIYDAHNNLRSHIICWLLRGPFGIWGRSYFIRRHIPRFKRFLLFRFRKRYFEMPFSGQRDLLDPLKPWGISRIPPAAPQIEIPSVVCEKVHAMLPSKPFIAFAASAAYALKRWPLDSWKQLRAQLESYPIVLLGGPKDEFLDEIKRQAPEQVINLVGKLSLVESAAVVKASICLVANDTGVLHMGEQLGVPTVALMGPAPFGFPCRPKTRILELDLWCRPCSKHGQGPCINSEYQKCLRDISSNQVALAVKEITNSI